MPQIAPMAVMPNVPPGLQYLQMLDNLFVRQCIEPLELLTGIETANAYEVFANGFMLYWAQEQSDFCARQCCGPNRPFTMTVSDMTRTPVMRMHRPYRCSCCLCWCCLQKMIVEAPVGVVVGSVEQDCTACSAVFTCKDASGAPVMRIVGPSACCRCCKVTFKVMNTQGQEVGEVTKQWAGYIQEAFTDADQFGITFPRELPVQDKAVILGACFLIDFMYFERKAARDNK